MNSADMAHLVPNPDDLLNVSMPEQGRLILRLLTLADNPTSELTGPTKSGRFSYHNFFNRANDFAAPLTDLSLQNCFQDGTGGTARTGCRIPKPHAGPPWLPESSHAPNP